MQELSESESGSSHSTHIKYQSNFGRSVASLFKKSFLIKIRRPAAIIEIILALIIWIIIYPCWLLARDKSPGRPNPQIRYSSMIPYRLVAFFAITKNSTFVIAPDCNNTRVLASMINFTINTAIDLFFLAQNSNVTDSNNTNDWISGIIDQIFPGLDDWLNQTLNGTLGPNISFGDFNFSDINFTGFNFTGLNFTDLLLNYTNSNNVTIDDILNDIFNNIFNGILNRTSTPTPNPAHLLSYDEYQLDDEIQRKSIRNMISSEFISYIKTSIIEGLNSYFDDYDGNLNLQHIRNYLKEYLVDKINDYLISMSELYIQNIQNYDNITDFNSKNSQKPISRKISSIFNTNKTNTTRNRTRRKIKVDNNDYGYPGSGNEDDEDQDGSNIPDIDYGQYVNLTEI